MEEKMSIVFNEENIGTNDQETGAAAAVDTGATETTEPAEVVEVSIITPDIMKDDELDAEIMIVLKKGIVANSEKAKNIFIPARDVSWDNPEDCRTLKYRHGDKIKVKVTGISDDGNVYASMKCYEENPNKATFNLYNQGDKAYGPVLRKIRDNRYLVEIDEIRKIICTSKPGEEINPGDMAFVKITYKNPDTYEIFGRIVEVGV